MENYESSSLFFINETFINETFIENPYIIKYGRYEKYF